MERCLAIAVDIKQLFVLICSILQAVFRYNVFLFVVPIKLVLGGLFFYKK